MSVDTEYPDFLYLSDFKACGPRDYDAHVAGVNSRAFNLVCRYAAASANLITVENFSQAVASTPEEIEQQQSTRVFSQRKTTRFEDAFAIDRASLMHTIEQWRDGETPHAVGSAVMSMLGIVYDRYNEPAYDQPVSGF